MIVPSAGSGGGAEVSSENERIRQYERALRSFFARRCARGDLDDLVQEALARLLAAQERREVAYPAAYLFRIASNLLADRGRRTGETVVDISDYQEAVAAPPDQEHGRRLADLQMQLESALAELPLRCREVFVMRRFRDLTTPEIARVLGISHRMVQKHLSRAMTHIYLRLND